MTGSKTKRPTRSDPTSQDIENLTRLFNEGIFAEAEDLAKSLTHRYPRHGFGWKVLGVIYQEQNRFEESLVVTRKAISLLPEDASTHNNLGTALLGLDRSTEAEVSFRKALAIAPGYAKALNNLGTLLRHQGRIAQAEVCFRSALEANPSNALTHIRLGNTLELQNKLHEAHESYRSALDIRPDMEFIHSDLLHLLSLDAKITPEQLFAEHVAYGAQLEPNLREKWQPHNNTKEPMRRLRIGFVTADLYDHALANYLEPVFGYLADKATLSLHIYYNNTNEDAITRRLQDYLPNWNTVSKVTDEELAAQIRKDQIDILIDLNGHTVLNRLQTFAQKPAPVQVSWLGYLGTTGLGSMDYYVADTFWIPPGELDWQFTEKVAYLPTVVVFEPNHLSPSVNSLPALTNAYITFGSFNRQNKINDGVIGLWSTLMRHIPNSRMVLAAIPPEHQDGIIQMFEREGVVKSRLTFFGRVAQTDYLALHHQVDFCLDTFPFGGGATTAHAAWMGIPTLCLAGQTPAGRFGAAELHQLGLDEFIATSAEDFVAKGIYWAEHVSELSEVRQGMRARFSASPLAQYANFADHFEAMLHLMWQRWCKGLPPVALNVETITANVTLSAPKETVDPSAWDLRTLRRLYEQQNLEEAESFSRELIRKFPGHGLPRKLLGSILHKLGRFDEALAVHKATVEARPDDYEAHFNLAAEFQQQGLLDDSVRSYICAAGIRPNAPNVYCNLGNIFQTMGLFPEAEMYCRQAIGLLPTMALAHNNLGNALHAQGKYTESLASYREALALRPDWAEVYNNLAIALKDQGHTTEAQDAYHKALQLKPNWAAATSNLLYSLSLDLHTSPEKLHAEHIAFGLQFEPPLRSIWKEHTNTKAPGRRLHIGFVSGDFYDHALTNFLEPSFAFLANKEDLVLHAYYTHIYDDAATKRMRASFAHWHSAAGLSEDELADRIRADNIDILFDLSGHTAHNRLLTFARKPAPIQVSWLGYLGTSGMQAMDYYLCDKFWIPPGELDWQFSEKPAYLPAAFIFQPSPLAPEVNALPVLENGHITFGSFNRTNKLNPAVIVLWSMLLREVPDAQMVFGGIPVESQLELFHRFSDEGIEPSRLTFFPRSNLQEYLALHHQVDFCLDTFPYGGGATTAHAAWMGVPSLSLAGESPASRFGASAMHHLGLDGFIATSIDDYLAKGRYWAEHTAELAVIRQGMRERFNQSALGQHVTFADNLDALLRAMWQRWCDDLPPALIELDPHPEIRTASTLPELVNPTDLELDRLANLYEQKQYLDAEALAQTLTERFPQHGFAWGVLGYIYQAQERFDAALQALTRYIDIHPEEPTTYVNLGVVFSALNRLPEAEANLRKALDIAPNYCKAAVNLGMVLRLQGQFQESEVCCRRAVEIDSCDASAHIQLGNALEDQGRLSEAQASYYRADMAHEQRRAVAASNVLYLLNHDVLVEPQHLFAEHLAFGETFETPLRSGWQPHQNDKDPIRQLQIGFVSGDFCHHALTDFLEPAFEAIGKRQSLVLHAYYSGTREDAVTQRMRTYFVHWHPVAQLSDVQLAQQIRADGIDILIDLSGHTAKNRLMTFARKPAPVQMSWLGYLGTTGLQAMDYYVCDAYWIPPGELDWQFVEKMAYLPSAAVFEPSPLAPPVNELPALRNGYITFGSFNRVTKINDSVIALWSMVMQNAPKSQLVLAGIEAASQQTITTTFAEHGINVSRLKFFPRLATADYLALHQQVDICLDTFPHGGGATTAHAAWMGIPTLCLAGETPASRFSASLMHHLGLDSFVARSIEEFVDHASEWVQNTRDLANVRAQLRAQFIQSNLCKMEAFGQAFETLLQNVWQQWCSTHSVEDCYVPLASTTQQSGQDNSTLAQNLIQLAKNNEASDNLVAAACLYQEVLKLAPLNATVNFRLGIIEFKLNGAALALPRFEAAVQSDPQEESHWVAYIEALLSSGAIDTAASAIEWGQKFGLSTAMAEKMAADSVSALEHHLDPESKPSSYSIEELALPPAPPWPDPKPSSIADLNYLLAPRSSGRRYIIYAPLYRHNSAGIRVCFELQKWLILAGYDALVIAATNGYADNQFEDDIVIYPEVIRGNPLKARRVVRYIMNYPGKIGGDKTYAPHELLVAYNPELTSYSGGAMLQLPTTESFFYKDNTPKTRNAVYVGKRRDLKVHPKDCDYITGSFPSTRRQVADFLRSVETLYTYDEFTILIHEAKICGCDVRYIDSNGKIGDVLHAHFSTEDAFKRQLHDFIDMTQRL